MKQSASTFARVSVLPTVEEILLGKAPFQVGEITIQSALVSIGTETDVVLGRREARRLARCESIALSELDVAAFLTSVSELAMNTLVHGGGGSLVLTLFRQENSVGIRATLVDQGPGVADFAAALQDGASTGGGLGCGLPGVVRLVGELHLLTMCPGGTVASTAKIGRSVLRIANSRPDPQMSVHANRTSWLRLGTCLVPADGSAVCGDAFFEHLGDGLATLAAVDGLGHGASAAKAARRAIACLANRLPVAFPAIFTALDEALVDTVGAAAAIMIVDSVRHRVAFSGIGNVRGRLLGTREVCFDSVAGIVGEQHEPVRVDEQEYRQGDRVLLFSDGVGVPRRIGAQLPCHSDPVQTAKEIMRRYRNAADDAVVLAAQ